LGEVSYNVSDISAPVLLEPGHSFDSFDCGKPAIDRWLLERARKAHATYGARVFVACIKTQVVAYYSLSNASIKKTDVPTRAKKDMRVNPVPATLIGQFGIDRRLAGQGVGRSLAQDALQRAFRLARESGSALILVDALDDEARAFWEKFGFQPTKISDYKLYLRVIDLEATYASL
jgi:GNAT superfamily N-acetyltransferase